MIANPARNGQLNRGQYVVPVRACEMLVSWVRHPPASVRSFSTRGLDLPRTHGLPCVLLLSATASTTFKLSHDKLMPNNRAHCHKKTSLGKGNRATYSPYKEKTVMVQKHPKKRHLKKFHQTCNLVSPDLIMSWKCVTMTFTAESIVILWQVY